MHWSQGDPLSPYLFILALKILAISIRENPEIQGIKNRKLVQYADNTTAVLSNLTSFNALFQQLDIFKNSCGLEFNSSKTESQSSY